MAKLGGHKRPAVVRVRSEEKAREILAFGRARGWTIIVGVEPHEEEDITDLEKLINAPPAPQKPERAALAPRISGNDYCPCRSGKKHKNCCGALRAARGV